MAKLLPTRLPVATTEISVDLYNRLIRILELNLGEFDPAIQISLLQLSVTPLYLIQVVLYGIQQLINYKYGLDLVGIILMHNQKKNKV